MDEIWKPGNGEKSLGIAYDTLELKYPEVINSVKQGEVININLGDKLINGSGVPSIEITSLPQNKTERIKGRASHVYPTYQVALYLKVSERFYSKPFYTKNYADVRSDGTFSSLLFTGGNDENFSEVYCFLYDPQSYQAPITAGNAKLPDELFINSVAWDKTPRD